MLEKFPTHPRLKKSERKVEKKGDLQTTGNEQTKERQGTSGAACSGEKFLS